MKKEVTAVLAVIVMAGMVIRVFAHCQIPCGIYGDETRFNLMREHVATIEKSMIEINRISKDQRGDTTKQIRWVANKEEHAEKLEEIVTFYFMSQRIKPVSDENKKEYDAYVEKVTLLHRMLVKAMKAKQTTDTTHCEELRNLISEFETSYNDK